VFRCYTIPISGWVRPRICLVFPYILAHNTPMLSLETVLLHFRTLLTARGLASHLCGSARGGAVYTLSLALYVSMANDCHVSKLQINRMSLQIQSVTAGKPARLKGTAGRDRILTVGVPYACGWRPHLPATPYVQQDKKQIDTVRYPHRSSRTSSNDSSMPE
jgi:hypothetical protein